MEKTAKLIGPDDATIYEHLGDVYQMQGKSAEAREAWQKALKLTVEPNVSERIKTKLAK